MGRKPIGGIFSMGVEEPYRWKDSVQNGRRNPALGGGRDRAQPAPLVHQVQRQGASTTAGCSVVEDIYGWHYRNERYLRNERSLARVALVYSQQTATFYGGEQARPKVEDHALGFYQALVEARIPFDMVHDRLLDAAHISQYRTLILPNIAALSDGTVPAAHRIRRAAAAASIATHETSLYDEWGVRRADFGLAKLFGASYDGTRRSRMFTTRI